MADCFPHYHLTGGIKSNGVASVDKPLGRVPAINAMNANPVIQFLLLFVLCNSQSVRAEEPVRILPVLTARVIFSEGSFFGYMPPRVGDTMRLDLEALDCVTNRIAFQGGKSPGDVAPYIPLLAPLRIEKIERDQDGRLLLARLVSGAKISDGTERVIIDIQRFNTNGVVWIIQEHEIVMSVARLACEFSK